MRRVSMDLRWTEAELKTEFEPILEEQAKLYNADVEWQLGRWLYPNQRGDYKLVVDFDPNYKARSDQLLEIDPRPRCWTVVYRRQHFPTTGGLVYGYGSRNFFETRDEAEAELARTSLEIEKEARMKEITKLSVRRAQCASCSKVHDWDEEKKAYYGMWSFMPHKEFDDTYDGCKGWD